MIHEQQLTSSSLGSLSTRDHRFDAADPTALAVSSANAIGWKGWDFDLRTRRCIGRTALVAGFNSFQTSPYVTSKEPEPNILIPEECFLVKLLLLIRSDLAKTDELVAVNAEQRQEQDSRRTNWRIADMCTVL